MSALEISPKSPAPEQGLWQANWILTVPLNMEIPVKFDLPPTRPHFGVYNRFFHLLRDDGERIFRLGLAADVGLAAGKAFAGCVSGSTAVIADAAHSISDVVLSSVALFSFKAARIPKDKEHPYAADKVLQGYTGTTMPNTDQGFRLNWVAFSMGNRRPEVAGGAAGAAAAGASAVGGAGSDMSIFVGDLASDVCQSKFIRTSLLVVSDV